MAKETFKAARARLFRELPAKGYKVVTYNMGRTLKSPYVIDAAGRRFTFSTQALHDEIGHSLWMDIRGMSVEQFDREVQGHRVLHPEHRDNR
ncbi:MAG: hypothetical protein ACYDH4_11320 [Candidatus Cryosericum sp.]